MIFENINIVSNKEEFLEKILIYIRLVEVTADYNGLVLSNDVDINNDLFENNKTMETLKDVMTEEALDFDRAMSYPTYCPTGLGTFFG